MNGIVTTEGLESSKDTCRVLIVEDNTDAADFLAVSLKHHNHDVQTTRNGTEALMVAENYRPHIVLMDIGLPGLDGLYVTKQLRKSHDQILIIAMTGRSSAEDVQRSRDAGCDHHLVKPLDLNAIFNLLDDWKGRSGCHG